MVELTQEETEILSQILTKKIPRAESMISGINNFFINKNNVSINSLNK
jgi:hypothetical protein